MGRLFVYDENMTDERAKITVAKMAAVSDIVASEKAFIQYSAAGQLTVLAGAVIAVGDAIFQTEETTLSAANLDGASSFAHGKDYYIYLCNNGKDSSNEVYLISENSTFPDGVEWDDTNTRKIGGFHYGFVRNVDEYGREVNTSGSVRGSGWESNVREDIAPNSVWTALHRPKCDPSGMAYLGNGLWADIYLASDDGANGLQSVYNATPITGTEGLNWYIANEKAARALAKNPKLLLCDEPTGALDYNTGKAVLKLLQDTCRKKGVTVVVITHNQAITAMADRIITVKNGTVTDMRKNEHIVPVEQIEW